MKWFKNLWNGWKRIAKIIGNFQARIIFTLFYFAILWMAGFVVRLGSDPLNTKAKLRKTNWDNWDHPDQTLEDAGKQY